MTYVQPQRGNSYTGPTPINSTIATSSRTITPIYDNKTAYIPAIEATDEEEEEEEDRK